MQKFIMVSLWATGGMIGILASGGSGECAFFFVIGMITGAVLANISWCKE